MNRSSNSNQNRTRSTERPRSRSNTRDAQRSQRSSSTARNAKRSNSRNTQRSQRSTSSSRKPRQSSTQSRPARNIQQPVRGKRKSVKATAQRQAKRGGAIKSKNLKRVQNPKLKAAKRITAALAIIAIIACAGAAAFVFNFDNSKYTASEQWRPVVTTACNDCGLDPKWTDCLLAAMVVESGANEDVDSVTGMDGDIMQAAEGAFSWVVKDGWPEHSVAPETPEASIYAGVMEFKQNLELWESYLGEFTPEDTTEIQLVIQGYNFGADGWFNWCKNRGIRAYTVELAQEYSNTQMPEGAKGTPTHAQKWLNAYNVIHKSK